MSKFDVVALLLRLSLGGVMVAHGWNHLWGPGGIAGTTGWFASMGLKPARLHALASGLIELFAGLALAVGLLTGLGCAAVLGVMVVAFATAHRSNGFFIFKPGQGWEYVGFLSAATLALAILGPGKVAVDRALGIDGNLSGGIGALLCLAGVLGAGLLLATCWRPPTKVESAS